MEVTEENKETLKNITIKKSNDFWTVSDKIICEYLGYPKNLMVVIESTFLKDVIKFIDLNVSDIWEYGFRICPLYSPRKLLKNWDLIKDPNYIIKESTIISPPKGELIVVHVVNYLTVY